MLICWAHLPVDWACRPGSVQILRLTQHLYSIQTTMMMMLLARRLDLAVNQEYRISFFEVDYVIVEIVVAMTATVADKLDSY